MVEDHQPLAVIADVGATYIRLALHGDEGVVHVQAFARHDNHNQVSLGRPTLS